MSHVEYLLNSVAWSLIGGIVVISYQQMVLWNRRRTGRPEFIKFTPLGFVGAFVMLMTIITFLFSESAALHQKQVNETNHNNNVKVQAHLLCVDAIQQQNVIVENERAHLNDGVTKAFQQIAVDLVHDIQNPADSTNGEVFAHDLIAEVKIYNDAISYKMKHPIQNSATCPTAPGAVTPSKTPAPAQPSQDTTPAPTK